MLTMPRRYPGKAPPGERRVSCDFCGIKWYRRASGMYRDASGQLRCPDCADGRDAVTLDRINAEAAASARVPSPGGDD